MSEKTVALTGVFKNVSVMKLDDSRYGEEEDHFGLYWRAWALRVNTFNGQKTPELLTFGFGCQEWENPNNWTVEVEYEFHLHSKFRNNLIQKGKESFKKNDTDYVLLNVIKWEDIWKFLINDTITVEYRITIKKVTGFPDFDSRPEFTDVFAFINGEKYTWSIEKLKAAKSPYFDSLLDKEFEKGKKPEITMKWADEDCLMDFSSVFHGNIDDDNVLGALYVAESYEAHAIVEKCKEYLDKPSSRRLKRQYEEETELSALLSKVRLSSEATSDEPPMEAKEAPTMFEKWNCLTDDLKIYCIGKMDFKSKYLLRGTSRTERRLVNSHRFKFNELILSVNPSYFDGEFMYEDNGEHYFLKSSDPEYINNTLYPLLSFVLEHGDIHWFQSDNFPMLTPEMLSHFKNEGPYYTKRVMFLGGSSQQIQWFFKRCVKDYIETIEMCQPEEDRALPFDQFMAIPAFATTKTIILNGLRTPGIAVKMAMYFIRDNAEIGKQLKFCIMIPGTFNEFVSVFKQRIIQLIPNQQVQIGMTSQKQIILKLDRFQNLGDLKFEMFVLAVVPPKMTPEEYHMFTKYNHLSI